MFVMQISKHSPENCPGFVPKNKAIALKWYEKIDEIAAKHKVKVVGAWTDGAAHETYVVYDTPSMDALMRLMTEPEVMAPLAFCTSELKYVISANESLASLRR
jgi:hypothetical protein